MSGVFIPALLFVVALGAVSALIPRACHFALRSRFVDRPGGRKEHERFVPPIGGVGVFPVVIVLGLFSGLNPIDHWPLLTALVLLLGTGLVDDLREVNANLKFFIQALAAFLIVVPGGAQIETLGNLIGLGPLDLGWFAIPFTWFCMVLLINAFNMIDGLDGLAGGKALIVTFWLAMACLSGGFIEPLSLLFVLAGGLAGFLVYNMRHPWRRRASVFLGDSGSMALGLLLGWFCVGLAQAPDPVLLPMSVAWVVALPVIDAFGLFTGRILRKQHPFSADRRHFHHHFIAAGFSPGQATAFILGIGFIYGLIGYGCLLTGIPETIQFVLWACVLAGHTAVSFRPALFIQVLAKLKERLA